MPTRERSPHSELPEPKGTQVWVAIIAAIATVIVGFWQFGPHPDHRGASVLGRVSAGSKGAIASAKVTLERAGQSPEIHYTDSEGHFSFVNIPDSQVIVRVEANGYQPYSRGIGPGDFQDIQLVGNHPPVNPELVKLVSEFDNRLADIEGLQKQLADPKITQQERTGLSVLIWRVWYGDHEYRATDPEFDNVRWVAIVAKLRALGLAEGSATAEKAIHDIEQGNPGGVYDPSFLAERTALLHQYSDSVLHSAISVN
jgi:hypothetical protein